VRREENSKQARKKVKKREPSLQKSESVMTLFDDDLYTFGKFENPRMGGML